MKLFSRLIVVSLLATILVAIPANLLQAAGKADHIIVFVWDGMRPDFISPQYTPTLYELAQQGVFFKNHHAVFISATEVNGTALATGAYPARSGIFGNSDYRPELGWLGPNATEAIDTIRRGDLLSNGKFIQVPTLAEILQQAGYPTIIAGTKPVVILHDRSNKRALEAAAKSVNFYKGRTIPRAALDIGVKANDDKQFPTNTIPNNGQDTWTVKAVTHGYWKKGLPKYTLFWMSDPDYSQHDKAPGDDTVLTALENNDKHLADILKALDEKKVRQKTDIFIVSDHGFSTVQRGPDVTEALKKAKFKAMKKFEDPEPGDILVVGLGGSDAFYVYGQDEALIRKLVAFLQGTDFAGAIFSRIPIEGTFPLAQARINTSENTPDVVMSCRWTMEKNANGAPGMIMADGGGKGKGTHGSLCPSDMHNTLVAVGPDIKKGVVNELPTGNVDLAPTILYLLGVSQPSDSPMDGRVLHEALLSGKEVTAKPTTKTVEATSDLGILKWRQYLKVTEYGGVSYFDEGNGEPTVK